MHRGTTEWGPREVTAIPTPGGEASGGASPGRPGSRTPGPQGRPTTSVLLQWCLSQPELTDTQGRVRNEKSQAGDTSRVFPSCRLSSSVN